MSPSTGVLIKRTCAHARASSEGQVRRPGAPDRELVMWEGLHAGPLATPRGLRFCACQPSDRRPSSPNLVEVVATPIRLRACNGTASTVTPQLVASRDSSHVFVSFRWQIKPCGVKKSGLRHAAVRLSSWISASRRFPDLSRVAGDLPTTRPPHRCCGGHDGATLPARFGPV